MAHERPPDPARPKLQTTSLWYHPGQQHAAADEGDSSGVSRPQRASFGDPRFEGRTPSYVIWNLLERYTRPGDTVLDPFCGGGTTLDVAASLGRTGLGSDLAPTRRDIRRADARQLPFESSSVDFVFMDPPYSTHVEYSEDARCIGKLEAFDSAYFAALEQVFSEVSRVLRPRRYLAVYVQDSYKKKRGFIGIGARLFVQLERRFEAVDHIAVVRGNRKLENPRFHRTAVEGNFFLRGFNHLLVFRHTRTD
jgi:adenine-specific DNA-methyltransferase